MQWESIHKRIWWVLLASTIFWITSVLVLSFFIQDFTMTQKWLYLALFSAFPMTLMFASYFYLFQKFPAHQIVPLFWLSSIWLLSFELLSGASIPFLPLLWVLSLLYGAYMLDVGSFSWKIPTKLAALMIPVSFLWAFILYLILLLPENDTVLQYFFYQFIGITCIGIWLFICVKQYRDGFIQRIQKQGKIFLWWSVLNEWLSQMSFLTSMIAVSLAPLATYVTAISSAQYLFLFILFFLFPLHERNKITPVQVFAIVLMLLGIVIIDIFK